MHCLRLHRCYEHFLVSRLHKNCDYARQKKRLWIYIFFDSCIILFALFALKVRKLVAIIPTKLLLIYLWVMLMVLML